MCQDLGGKSNSTFLLGAGCQTTVSYAIVEAARDLLLSFTYKLGDVSF